MIFSISKIFTAFILPPGFFILILALCSIFIKRARLPLGLAAAFLYLISINPVADKMLSYYEDPFRSQTIPQKANAVVTLGGGNIEGNPIPLVDESFKRHIYGLSIAKKLDIPVIVSGRGDEGYNEFLGLLDTLRALDPIVAKEMNVSKGYVEHFAIIPETESADTYENAKNAVSIIGKEDPAIIVVTSAYHMKRALRLFRLAGVKNLYPAAVNFYINRGKSSYDWRDFLPSIEALSNSYRAMHEFFGLIKVRLRELRG